MTQTFWQLVILCDFPDSAKLPVPKASAPVWLRPKAIPIIYIRTNSEFTIIDIVKKGSRSIRR